MLNNDLSGKLWPVHLKPKDDELLSSWLARLSISHGQAAASFFYCTMPKKAVKESPSKRDIDRSVRVEIIEVLAAKTDTPMEKVINTTLAAYEGFLYEKNSPSGSSIWILPIGVSYSSPRRPGLQFCPQCLKEDAEPNFRRVWRLAFTVLCVKHGVPLLDRCATCGNAVDVYKGWSALRRGLPKGPLSLCHICGVDYRDIVLDSTTLPVVEDEIEYQRFLLNVARRGWVEIPGSGTVYSHLYFAVLHQLMRLLSVGHKGEALRKSISQRYGVAMFDVVHPIKYKELLGLNVGERRGLLRMAGRLLNNWPNDFIDFCQANKLWSNKLFEDFAPIPFWYWSVVHDHLVRTVCELSDEEIISAYNYWCKLEQQAIRTRPLPENMRPLVKFFSRVSSDRRIKLRKLYGININLKIGSSQNLSDGMVMGPRQVPDHLWEDIQKLLLKPATKGRRNAVDERQLFNGVLYGLCTNCAWHSVPTEFGTPIMLYKRYIKWTRMGIIEEIMARCLYLYD